MRSHLHYARIVVGPDPGHPRYYDFDTAILQLYFYADSDDDAIARAKAFPSFVRWELREIAIIARLGTDTPEPDPVCADLIAEAQEIGIAWRTIGIAVGGDPECQPLEPKDPAGKQ